MIYCKELWQLSPCSGFTFRNRAKTAPHIPRRISHSSLAAWSLWSKRLSYFSWHNWLSEIKHFYNCIMNRKFWSMKAIKMFYPFQSITRLSLNKKRWVRRQCWREDTTLKEANITSLNVVAFCNIYLLFIWYVFNKVELHKCIWGEQLYCHTVDLTVTASFTFQWKFIYSRVRIMNDIYTMYDVSYY